MATRADTDRVQLLVGEGAAARIQADWIRYDVDSDLLTPADAWSMTLSMPAGRVPAVVRGGAAARLVMGSDTLMVGRVDRVRGRVDKGGATLSITGRDGAGVLLDCSAPVIAEQQLTLAEVVAKIVRPLGVSKIVVSATNALAREKILVQPGDSAWDALRNAAEANGLGAWFTPDGTLVVGGPDYTTPAVATLVHRVGGSHPGNNILDIELEDGVAESYSELTVLGQAHGGGELRKASNVKGSYKDPSVPYYRPRVVVDYEVDTPKHATERARKLMMDSRLQRWTCRVTVHGHRIDAPGMPGHGRPWEPGQRVNLRDEAFGLDGVFFVMGRKLSGGRDGCRTVLTLKEDGVWIVAAHAHKRRHRREKVEGAIWDISRSPEAGQ